MSLKDKFSFFTKSIMSFPINKRSILNKSSSFFPSSAFGLIPIWLGSENLIMKVNKVFFVFSSKRKTGIVKYLKPLKSGNEPSTLSTFSFNVNKMLGKSLFENSVPSTNMYFELPLSKKLSHATHISWIVKSS